MKTRHPLLLILAILALLLPATIALAADGEAQSNDKGEAGSENPGAIEGEVIAVQRQTRTQNGGETREITVRTREQQEVKLRLGPAGDGAPQYRKGDQIRAQIQTGRTTQTGQGDGAYQVRTMTNLRTGRQETFGEGEATAVQQQTRQRNRDGSGDGPQRARTRQRIHEPGTGDCPRGNTGSRGGSGRGGSGGGGQGRGGNGRGGGRR
jgi:hypothetical protein